MTGSNDIEVAGYRFVDQALLRQALTHRSHNAAHNERLEFLGDSILNCVIAAELFSMYPAMAEGDLSRVRASLVNGQNLSVLANQLDARLEIQGEHGTDIRLSWRKESAHNGDRNRAN